VVERSDGRARSCATDMSRGVVGVAKSGGGRGSDMSGGGWTTPVVHTASFLHPAVVHGVNDSAVPSSLQVITDLVVQRAVFGLQTVGAGSMVPA